jgi:hypothetical protein
MELVEVSKLLLLAFLRLVEHRAHVRIKASIPRFID